MTGWEVQEMWESETNALWERLNEPDPCEKEMHDAAADMKKSGKMIDKAEDLLVGAVSSLSGTPMEDRVQSLLDSLIDLEYEIRTLADKYEKGVRE